jgi:hypothetical protein
MADDDMGIQMEQEWVEDQVPGVYAAGAWWLGAAQDRAG